MYVHNQSTGGIKRYCQTLVCVLPSGWQAVCIEPTNYIANNKYPMYFFLSEVAKIRITVVCFIISVSRQESGKQRNPKGLAASISWINYSSNYYVNVILINPKYFNFFRNMQDILHKFVLWVCLTFPWGDKELCCYFGRPRSKHV